jgi:hypothetical protein
MRVGAALQLLPGCRRPNEVLAMVEPGSWVV